MVLKKRLDYGFNGFQVPHIPRAPRSVRVSTCGNYDTSLMFFFLHFEHYVNPVSLTIFRGGIFPRKRMTMVKFVLLKYWHL